METRTEGMENSYELCQEADRILREKGFGIFGRPLYETDFQQARFEKKMQLGAYSRNGESRRRN